MIFFSIEIGVVGRNKIDQLTQSPLGFVMTQIIIVIRKVAQIQVAHQLLQASDQQGAFLLGQVDPEALVDEIAQAGKFSIGNGHHATLLLVGYCLHHALPLLLLIKGR